MLYRKDVIHERHIILFDKAHDYKSVRGTVLEIYTTNIDLGPTYTLIPVDWIFGIIKDGVFYYVSDC